MERVVRIFGSHKEADAADREYYLSLTPAQRMEILWDILRMGYGDAGDRRSERVCRVVNLKSGELVKDYPGH